MALIFGKAGILHHGTDICRNHILKRQLSDLPAEISRGFYRYLIKNCLSETVEGRTARIQNRTYKRDTKPDAEELPVQATNHLATTLLIGDSLSGFHIQHTPNTTATSVVENSDACSKCTNTCQVFEQHIPF
jgi:hypothetical protein